MGHDRWRKLKSFLGMNLCVYVVPQTQSSEDDSLPSSCAPPSVTALLSPVTAWSIQDSASTTPSSSHRVLRLSKSLSRSSSKKTCSICLSSMKSGDGQAVFTAECAHSFHFQCIASSVKHGNQVCPICRAKWNEIPLQKNPILDPPLGKARRVNPVVSPLDNPLMTVIRRLPAPRHNDPPNRQNPPFLQAREPAIFNDDEALDRTSDKSSSSLSFDENSDQITLKIKTYPEVQAVPRFIPTGEFTVLVNLKAPAPAYKENLSTNQENLPRVSRLPRAPVDLVTVLDVSGSMAGTKLALMKRAMGFVIQNLSSNDRLAVIAFSSTARRVFPLCRMSETGRQQALLAVNSLVANGGTNIAEGLRKGAKIMEDRREMNPVASIILLSDGQDTYTVTSLTIKQEQPNYHLLLPLSIRNMNNLNYKIPVHTFGFGADHDASLMHAISELSGGTFSFIETEGVIQDAFAQCIGGLLSVMIKNLHVSIESVNPSVKLISLKAGSYPNRLHSDKKTGNIDVGDMYADEERNFLISVNVPVETSNNVTSLFKVSCVYNDPLSKETVTIESEQVIITRPQVAGKEKESASVEVERQKTRIQAADAMAQARSAAENGDLAGAASILEDCRKALSETISAKSGNHLCIALDAELKQMQDRLTSKNIYEASGRAYILSGLSSHSWQRATTRGDSIYGSSSILQSYQTPSMAEMLSRSQATLLGHSSSQKKLTQPLLSFASRSRPR